MFYLLLVLFYKLLKTLYSLFQIITVLSYRSSKGPWLIEKTTAILSICFIKLFKHPGIVRYTLGLVGVCFSAEVLAVPRLSS